MAGAIRKSAWRKDFFFFKLSSVQFVHVWQLDNCGRKGDGEKLNTLPEDDGANFGISSCPIMMIDSIGHGGQGSVDKLTLQISPSFEVEALLSGTPSL